MTYYFFFFFWFVCFSEIVLYKDGLKCAIMQTLSLWDHLLVTCKNSSRKYQIVLIMALKTGCRLEQARLFFLVFLFYYRIPLHI